LPVEQTFGFFKRRRGLGFNTFLVNIEMFWFIFILPKSYDEGINQYAEK
jgi:hypothetical protein